MILRRLKRSIAQQDWFTVLLELVILVVGVALGFQVTAWGEQNSERRTERELLEGLRSEFATNRVLFDQSGSDHAASIDDARRLLRFTGPEPDGFDEQVIDSLLFRAISVIPSFHPATGEWDARGRSSRSRWSRQHHR